MENNTEKHHPGLMETWKSRPVGIRLGTPLTKPDASLLSKAADIGYLFILLRQKQDKTAKKRKKGHEGQANSGAELELKCELKQKVSLCLAVSLQCHRRRQKRGKKLRHTFNKRPKAGTPSPYFHLKMPF